MGRLSLSLYRGQTLDLTLTWWTVRDVTARDLTGYAFRFQVRSAPGGAILLDLATGGSGITLVDAANGVFRIVGSAATTAAIGFTGNARFDLRATDAGGLVSYPWEGTMTIKDPVTA